MNQELLEYVKQAKASGQTVEAIRSALITSGWDTVSVAEAFGDPVPAAPPTATGPLAVEPPTFPVVAGSGAGRFVAFGAASAIIGDLAATVAGLLIAALFAIAGSTEAEFMKLFVNFGPYLQGLVSLLVAALILKRFGKDAIMAGAAGAVFSLVLLSFTGRNADSLGEGILLAFAAALGQLVGGFIAAAWGRGNVGVGILKARHWILMGLYASLMVVGSENALDTWVFRYALNLVLSLWIVLGGGAKGLEGTLASGYLVSWFAPRWSEEGIKIFVWGTLALTTIWFIIGLAVPDARL